MAFFKPALLKAVGAAAAITVLNRIPATYDVIEESIYLPLVHLFSPETAHQLALKAARYGLPPSDSSSSDLLRSEVLGLEFSNPIGLAAGFDKDCEAIDGLMRLGFGFVEVGSVTPQAQSGNPKPRVFRLPEDSAVINRYGFPSKGYEVAKQNIQSSNSHFRSNSKLGINLGVNKSSSEPLKDYIVGIEQLGSLADYLVINISSPNTPGLRDLQSRARLQELLAGVREHVRHIQHTSSCRFLLLKISPDLNDDDLKEVVELALDPENGVGGLIVSNTTTSRPENLQNPQKDEKGGLSGRPLKEISTEMIRKVYRLSDGKLPIIGVGGVDSAEDVYEKIKAGASLVQLYTSLIFRGLGHVRRIKRELVKLIEADGFTNIEEAVGADAVKVVRS